MNDRASRFLRGLSLVLAILVLAEAAGGALAVVGMREKKARYAQSALDLQREMLDTGRKLRSLDAQTDQDRQPDILRTRIGDQLAAPKSSQIVWVRPVPPSQNRPDVAPLPKLSLQFASLDPANAPAPPR